jgi:hypothetical protein
VHAPHCSPNQEQVKTERRLPNLEAAGKSLGRTAIGAEEDSRSCDFSITSVAKTEAKSADATEFDEIGAPSTNGDA